MLKEKKYFLFDIDGTIAVDSELYDGSRELFNYIEEIGGRSFFITNNSVKSRKDYVEKFARWDLKTKESQFMTASYATGLYLQKTYGKERLFLLGTPSFEEEMRGFGLNITTQVETQIRAVVVGFDQTLCYEKLEKACELLFRPKVDFVATNPDLRCPTAFGFVPDCGSICNMLTSTTDRKPHYVGKPNAQIVHLCMEQVGAKKEEVLVVGDRLYTDIACGIHAGVETAVVFTGEAKKEDLQESEYPADYAFTNIRALYEAFRKEREEAVCPLKEEKK